MTVHQQQIISDVHLLNWQQEKGKRNWNVVYIVVVVIFVCALCTHVCVCALCTCVCDNKRENSVACVVSNKFRKKSTYTCTHMHTLHSIDNSAIRTRAHTHVHIYTWQFYERVRVFLSLRDGRDDTCAAPKISAFLYEFEFSQKISVHFSMHIFPILAKLFLYLLCVAVCNEIPNSDFFSQKISDFHFEFWALLRLRLLADTQPFWQLFPLNSLPAHPHHIHL